MAIAEADGGNFLDNTVLLWGNELGAGNTHTYKNIPWLLAGGASGYFKMGRYLRESAPQRGEFMAGAGAEEPRVLGARESSRAR